jgi:hypothetical protein
MTPDRVIWLRQLTNLNKIVRPALIADDDGWVGIDPTVLPRRCRGGVCAAHDCGIRPRGWI